MGKACEIGKIKKLSGVDPYDPAREEQVFNKLSGYSDGPLRDVSLRAVYREIISASIALGERLGDRIPWSRGDLYPPSSS